MRLPSRGQRQPHRESCALSFAGAGDRSSSAMQLHQRLCDRETESQTAVGSCRGTVGLAESIEDIGKKILRDARTRIRHSKVHVRTLAADFNLDSAAFGREFNGV